MVFRKERKERRYEWKWGQDKTQTVKEWRNNNNITEHMRAIIKKSTGELKISERNKIQR